MLTFWTQPYKSTFYKVQASVITFVSYTKYKAIVYYKCNMYVYVMF